MPTIRVRNLKKNYGETEALKGISFDVHQGEILGFLGPNGAGKTTTMKILTCFMSAGSGEAQVAGHDCFKDNLAVRAKLGYLPENNPLYMDMTVFEYLDYMADLHETPANKKNERIKAVCTDCGLMDRLNSGLSTLSKGYRQRVGLSAALIHDPEILILDEPTVGLDPNQIIEIRNLIIKLGKQKTVILCSHNLVEVELVCNRVVIIRQGKMVASGTPKELKEMVEGHANLRVTVRGHKKEVEKILQSVKGVKAVNAEKSREKGVYDYEIITGKKDLRSEIVIALTQREIKEEEEGEVEHEEIHLLEIRRESVSLEEIFNELTK